MTRSPNGKDRQIPTSHWFPQERFRFGSASNPARRFFELLLPKIERRKDSARQMIKAKHQSAFFLNFAPIGYETCDGASNQQCDAAREPEGSREFEGPAPKISDS